MDAELLAYDLGDPAVEVVTVAIVDPGMSRVVPAVVPGARAGREPDLPRRGLPVQDEARTVVELERDQAVTRRHIDVFQLAEPAADPLQAGIGGAQVPLLVHRGRL